MIKIDVFVKNRNWNRYLSNPSIYLKSKAKHLNNSIKFIKNKKINFSVLLAGNEEVKKLNKKFRKKNKTTDILSFPFQTKPEFKKKLKKEKEIYIGDIIINLSKIKNKKVLNNFKYEFDRLWIHGLIHLLGYTHKKDKDFLKMSHIEKKYFNFVNV